MPKKVDMTREDAMKIIETNLKWQQYKKTIKKREDFFRDEFGEELPVGLISSRIAKAAAVMTAYMDLDAWNRFAASVSQKSDSNDENSADDMVDGYNYQED